MRAITGITLFGLVLATVPAGRAADPTPDELIAAFEKKVKQIAETSGPSVVQIVVSRSDKYPKTPKPERDGQLDGFDPQEFLRSDQTPTRATLAKKLDLSDRENIPDNSLANGVIIDAAGFVLTTYGAIEGATKLFVHLADGKGSYADIHAADARSDFAVLRLLSPPPRLRAILIGEARPEDALNGPRRTVFRGKLIVLMPWNYSAAGESSQPAVWVGSLTGVPRRSIPAREYASRKHNWYRFGFVLEFQTVLRPSVRGATGASLSGNGVPILTLDGEVIGLTSTLAAVAEQDPGPGYALPIDTNGKRIIETLRRGEEVEYGFLGVTVLDDVSSLSLREITANSPAAHAGLLANDTITLINGLPTQRFEDLLLHAGTSLAGNRIKLQVRGRNGQFRDVEVTLAKYAHDLPFIASRRPEPVMGLRVDYSSILNPRGGSLVPGVIVREVVANSPAAAKFKTLGDDPNRWAILAVNGNRTPTPADFYKAARGQATLKLTVLDLSEQNPQERDVTIP